MHNCEECKHEKITLCPKCWNPYCEECGKEWFEECELNHYQTYPYYFPYTQPDVLYGTSDTIPNPLTPTTWSTEPIVLW